MVHPPVRFAKADLSLDVLAHEGGFVLTAEYDAELFGEPTVRRFTSLYTNLVRQLLESDPGGQLADIQPVATGGDEARSAMSWPGRTGN